jgi:AP-4 complex subunit epsilon-1
MDHKYPLEYDYHKLPAPWIQIDILKILEKLGKNDNNTSKLM